MATYYIAPQTGSDANPGTEAQPRLTPPAAANGDIWYFKRGETYTRASQLSLGAATGMTLDAYGTGDYPVITLLTSNTNALNIQGDGTHYIRNLWFKDCTTSTNGGVVGLGLITGPGYAASAEITDCKLTGCNFNAIRSGGTSTATAALRIVIRDCVFDDIGEDCFYGPALYLEVARNRMTNVSSRTTTGDGVGFLGADPTLVWIYGNHIDHSTVDSRHCIIVDTSTGAGTVVIHDNVLIGYGSETVQSVAHAVTNTDCRADIRRNYIRSARIAASMSGASSVFSANVVDVVNAGADAAIVAMSASNISVTNNTIKSRITLDPAQKAVVQAAAASNGVVQNNIFENLAIAIQSDNPGNNPTATFNCFWNVTTPRRDQAGNAFAGGNDQTVDPQLRGDYVPQAAAVRTGGTYLGGKDYYGKEFWVTTPIGAVQPQEARTLADRAVTKRSIAG